jgi:hypothetical protein
VQERTDGVIVGQSCRPDWTPEQALAVFELLDDLRERIWVHYQLEIAEQLREERQTNKAVPEISDPPF